MSMALGAVQPEPLEFARVAPPPRPHLDPQVQIDRLIAEPFDLHTRRRANLPESFIESIRGARSSQEAREGAPRQTCDHSGAE